MCGLLFLDICLSKHTCTHKLLKTKTNVTIVTISLAFISNQQKVFCIQVVVSDLHTLFSFSIKLFVSLFHLKIKSYS